MGTEMHVNSLCTNHVLGDWLKSLSPGDHPASLSKELHPLGAGLSKQNLQFRNKFVLW